MLKKVIDANGETFVLHIEWQLEDEQKMQYRMLEYYAMLAYRYELPVHQYVIYLGKGNPMNMKDHLQLKGLEFSYDLIVFSAIDYRLLLEADKPEEKMLAILGDFGQNNPRQIVKTIVNEVAEASEGGLARQRNLKQLRILANLRNLESKNITIMDNGPIFKIENDIYYKFGQQRGMEKGQVKCVESLLRKTNHSIREIASLMDVTEYFVRKVKRSLLAGKGSGSRRKVAKAA